MCCPHNNISTSQFFRFVTGVLLGDGQRWSLRSGSMSEVAFCDLGLDHQASAEGKLPLPVSSFDCILVRFLTDWCARVAKKIRSRLERDISLVGAQMTETVSRILTSSFQRSCHERLDCSCHVLEASSSIFRLSCSCFTASAGSTVVRIRVKGRF